MVRSPMMKLRIDTIIALGISKDLRSSAVSSRGPTGEISAGG